MIVPDFREIKHSNELYHYGIPRRSGRYPWGSGDKPYQSREERREARRQRRRERDISIGRERLENRINKANEIADVDKLSRKVGWKYTQEAGEAHKKVKNIKAISKEIYDDEKRSEKLGKYTRRVRIADVAVTSASIASVSGMSAAYLMNAWGASAATLAVPVVPGLILGKLGYDFYQKTKY